MEQIEKLKEQLRKQEKLASLGVLSAGIAHEIQNPLNFVINFSKMSDKLLNDLTEIVEDNEDKLNPDDREDMEDIMADLRENMAKIVEHGERAINIIQGILLVSRGKSSCLLMSARSSRSTYGYPIMPCAPTIKGSTSPSTKSTKQTYRM